MSSSPPSMYQNSDVITGLGKRERRAADDLSLRLRVRDHDHDLVVRRLRLLRSLHSLGLFNHDPVTQSNSDSEKTSLSFWEGISN